MKKNQSKVVSILMTAALMFSLLPAITSSASAASGDATLYSIAVTTKPTKTIYYTYEPLDPTGMVVTATYSDNSTKVVTGYTITPTKLYALNSSADVTISYTEGEITKSTCFNVTVWCRTLSRLEVTTKPTKLTYTVGSQLNVEGMVLTAIFEQGPPAVVDPYMVYPTALDTIGTQNITVSFVEQGVIAKTSFDVTVTAPTLSSIAVTTQPTKKSYAVGSTLDTAGMVVTATYDNNSTAVVTGYSCSPTTLGTVGTQTVTVSYTKNGTTKTASFDVTVTDLSAVTYENNYSGASEPYKVEHASSGSVLRAPSDPQRDGYTFFGWYKDKACTDGNAWNFSNDPVTADMTLYAKWTASTYTITYVLNSGTNDASNPASYTYGTAVTLASPTRAGYTFGGWYSDSGFGTAATGVTATDTGAKTFYAKWTANSYTVTAAIQGSSGTGVGLTVKAYATGDTNFATVLDSTTVASDGTLAFTKLDASTSYVFVMKPNYCLSIAITGSFASLSGKLDFTNGGTQQFLKGDMNNDDIISVTDLTAFFSGYSSSNLNADLNEDGSISVQDLSIFGNNYGKSGNAHVHA